jgi:hypothetical protein
MYWYRLQIKWDSKKKKIWICKYFLYISFWTTVYWYDELARSWPLGLSGGVSVTLRLKKSGYPRERGLGKFISEVKVAYKVGIAQPV